MITPTLTMADINKFTRPKYGFCVFDYVEEISEYANPPEYLEEKLSKIHIWRDLSTNTINPEKVADAFAAIRLRIKNDEHYHLVGNQELSKDFYYITYITVGGLKSLQKTGSDALFALKDNVEYFSPRVTVEAVNQIASDKYGFRVTEGDGGETGTLVQSIENFHVGPFLNNTTEKIAALFADLVKKIQSLVIKGAIFKVTAISVVAHTIEFQPWLRIWGDKIKRKRALSNP
jgi:hypothetical protein